MTFVTTIMQNPVSHLGFCCNSDRVVVEKKALTFILSSLQLSWKEFFGEYHSS